MATHVQGQPNVVDYIEAGRTSAVYYTFVVGTVVYIGTDDDANTGVARPSTNDANHAAVGISLTTSAELNASAKHVMAIALWPLVILTDNVASGAPPEAAEDKFVYLAAGEWSDTDGDSSNNIYGQCIAVDNPLTDHYLLNLYGPST